MLDFVLLLGASGLAFILTFDLLRGVRCGKMFFRIGNISKYDEEGVKSFAKIGLVGWVITLLIVITILVLN